MAYGRRGGGGGGGGSGYPPPPGGRVREVSGYHVSPLQSLSAVEGRRQEGSGAASPRVARVQGESCRAL